MEIIKNIEIQKMSGSAVDVRQLMVELFNDNDIKTDALFIDKARLFRGRELENPSSLEVTQVVNVMRSNVVRYGKEISSNHTITMKMHNFEGEFRGVLIKFKEVNV